MGILRCPEKNEPSNMSCLNNIVSICFMVFFEGLKGKIVTYCTYVPFQIVLIFGTSDFMAKAFETTKKSAQMKDGWKAFKSKSC